MAVDKGFWDLIARDRREPEPSKVWYASNMVYTDFNDRSKKQWDLLSKQQFENLQIGIQSEQMYSWRHELLKSTLKGIKDGWD